MTGPVRGDRRSINFLDDASYLDRSYFPLTAYGDPLSPTGRQEYLYVASGDPRPRDHAEPPFAPFMAEHVNCRCVLVEDARTAIVDHEDLVPPLFHNLGDRRFPDRAMLEAMLGHGGPAADWSMRTPEEIYQDVKRVVAELGGLPPEPFVYLPYDLRTARHGPRGGLTRYGRPYAGRATVFGPPPPPSKRARRRARGKAKS